MLTIVDLMKENRNDRRKSERYIKRKYRNLEQKKDWKNQKLLGNDLKFSARDLINVYVELEKEFDIHFKEKDIVAGKFDTFDDIIKLINKEIAYKTRGKEHA